MLEEKKSKKISIINFVEGIKVPGLQGMSLYDVLKMYVKGIVEGALTTRAGGIAFSFFMAIFPFSLFFLSLIPYIPIEGFQEELFLLIKEVVPPKTFNLIDTILHDIINNQYGGLLSFGFIASIFLMTNGVNAIFGGFEYSYHITEYRNIFKAYFISLGVSLMMSLFLILTVSVMIFYEVALLKIDEWGWLGTNHSSFLYLGRGVFFLIMIFATVSLLFRYGTKQGKEVKFFSAGAVLTTFLMLFTSYLFSIYVLKFAKYNEFYGSIGTLLILMLFVWINSIILLLGFELNATISTLKNNDK